MKLHDLSTGEKGSSDVGWRGACEWSRSLQRHPTTVADDINDYLGASAYRVAPVRFRQKRRLLSLAIQSTLVGTAKSAQKFDGLTKFSSHSLAHERPIAPNFTTISVPDLSEQCDRQLAASD